MRTLKFLLQKEFKQIWRNKLILRLIIAMPIIQLLILPLAADFEIKNINIAIVDHDRSTYSQELISKINSTGYFRLTGFGNSYNTAYKKLENNKADLILEIPKNFERNMMRESQQQLFIAVNAINGSKAAVGAVYLGRIIMDFNADIRAKLIPPQRFNAIPIIDVSTINRFNQMMNYRFYMVPGILAFLVTIIAAFMCAINLVKEKEVGTIEQINVTPIKKFYFILAKLIPFWIIGMIVFTLGLFLIARLVYGIIPAGSLFVLYTYVAVYLVAVLGAGLLLSTYSNSLQQSMTLGFFFIMIFVLMSGLFTTIDGMPEWAKWITRFNPVTYFIDVMRMVVMKGSGFKDITTQFLATIGFVLFFNTWAILNYRKTS